MPKRLFAPGDLSDEETFRQKQAAPSSSGEASSHNFRPGAPTQLASLASDDKGGGAPEVRPDGTTRISAVVSERPVPAGPTPPPVPRTEMRSLREMGSGSAGAAAAGDGPSFRPDAPTRLENPLLDEGASEVELSMADVDGVEIEGSDGDGVEVDEDATESFAHPLTAAPEPPKLPTGFIDRAKLKRDAQEVSGGRPVPVPGPGEGVGPADQITNPFRAAATQVDLRSLSDVDPAISELDVEVDDSALAEPPVALPPRARSAPPASSPPSGPAGFMRAATTITTDPFGSDEDRAITQNIRVDGDGHPGWASDEDDDLGAPEVTDPQLLPPPAARVSPGVIRASSPPPAPGRAAATQMVRLPFEDNEGGDGFNVEQITQTEYVPDDESEVGLPEVARWKVVPTGWGEVPAEAAPPPSTPPNALRTVMWNLEEEEAAQDADDGPVAEVPRWSPNRPDRPATDGSALIATRYLGDVLNHLEELSLYQRQIESEARRDFNAKVFAAKQKLRRALDMLGATAVPEDD